MAERAANLPPRYLRTQEAARFLSLSERTLEKHRTYGTGPIYRTEFGRGFQYQRLSVSIASATQEIEYGEDRNYANSKNNPAAAVARDGADG
jgi:hypothetical protein